VSYRCYPGKFVTFLGWTVILIAGKPLNLRSSISWMASVIEASGEMHTGSGVMTSAALMASPPHLNFAHI
jgi:hypothetical protein